jgi:hypothetical protein
MFDDTTNVKLFVDRGAVHSIVFKADPRQDGLEER